MYLTASPFTSGCLFMGAGFCSFNNIQTYLFSWFLAKQGILSTHPVAVTPYTAVVVEENLKNADKMNISGLRTVDLNLDIFLKYQRSVVKLPRNISAII